MALGNRRSPLVPTLTPIPDDVDLQEPHTQELVLGAEMQPFLIRAEHTEFWGSHIALLYKDPKEFSLEDASRLNQHLQLNFPIQPKCAPQVLLLSPGSSYSSFTDDYFVNELNENGICQDM